MSVGDSLVLALADDLEYLINVQYPIVDTTDQNGYLSTDISYILNFTLPNFNELYSISYSLFIMHIAILTMASKR